MDNKQEDFDLAILIESGESQGESQADALAKKNNITPNGAKKTSGVISSFIRSYKDKEPEVSNELWLIK